MDHDQWPDPTRRANVEVQRERTGVYLHGKAGPLEGEVEVSADGPGGSAMLPATNMLLSAATASMSGLVVTAILWVAHISGLPLALTGIGTFSAVFATCTILVFRRPARSPKEPSPRPVVIQSDPQGAASRNGRAVQRSHEKTAQRNNDAPQIEGPTIPSPSSHRR